VRPNLLLKHAVGKWGIEDKKGEVTIDVQPALWSDAQRSDKFALDVRLFEGRRLRDLVKVDDDLPPYEEEVPLCNAIGASAMVVTKEEEWVIGLCNGNQAFDPGEWGCSVEGALDWADILTYERRTKSRTHNLIELVGLTIGRECEKELGFCRTAQENITYLALTRELAAVGKPQVFVLIKTTRTSADIQTAWCMYARGTSELEKLEFLSTQEAETVATTPKYQTKGRLVKLGGSLPSEELRMGLALSLRLLKIA
jgi:hypothetical protein